MFTQIELRAKLSNLAPLPEAVHQLMEALNRPSTGMAEVGRHLAAEPALSARVLRLANSPFYGFSGRIVSIKDACRVLGMQTLRNLLLTAAALEQFPSLSPGPLDLKSLWQHCAAVANAARVIAAHLRIDTETAFTAGLLHDIGRMILATRFPSEYETVVVQHNTSGQALFACERALLEMDHAVVGSLFAQQWKLPSSIATAIAGHHLNGSSEMGVYAQVLHVADSLCKELKLGCSGDSSLEPLPADVWARLGLPIEIIDTLREEIRVTGREAMTLVG